MPVELNKEQNAVEQLQAFGGLERHEMGHYWFDLWSKRHGAKDMIPYWMVESPAILMEDSVITATRYQNLKQLPALGARVNSLGELFTMKNPAVALASGADGSAENLMQAEMFYGECRAVFDFLVARTSDPSIFGSIALAVIKGSTMVEWLQANGSRHGLPVTVQELDKEWRSWLP